VGDIMDVIVQEKLTATTVSLEENWFLATVLLYQGKIFQIQLFLFQIEIISAN